jgi:methylmalonyl-CoA/ethylmalonyl-CoA epimerase
MLTTKLFCSLRIIEERGENKMRSKPVYVGLRVKDLDKSIEFYEFLGMKFVGRSKVEATKGEVASLESGTFIIELNYYERNSPYYCDYTVGEGLDHIAFQVENLDKALTEANSKGYKTLLQVNGEHSRWAYIEDPNGIWIELVT